jgi:hypothetical protein
MSLQCITSDSVFVRKSDGGREKEQGSRDKGYGIRDKG